jgi:tRNA nucleotidyltransferase (CCA-adding enzyme)
MVDGVCHVADLRDTLRALPCGATLLDAAASIDGAHLVGGAVRDLLRDVRPRELDVAVEGDTGALLTALGGEPRRHDRFGTASVRTDSCRFDVAMTRAESYARPGALPDVRPAGIGEDLRRRDVTVNAIALGLADGELRCAPGALEDLRDGLLRVLHDGSFIDDPTRLWRIARYRARLGFAIEPHTRELARAAVQGGALATVSGTRIGNELRLALAEDDPVAALESAAELGLAPWLDVDRARIERALAILPPEGDRGLTVLAAAAREALPELGLTGPAARAVALGLVLRGLDLRGASPSATARAFDGAPVEAVAATGTPEAERWLRADRHRRLAITGEDLLAAGVPAGPELGARLWAARAALLDGDVGEDAADQLQVALASPAS